MNSPKASTSAFGVLVLARTAALARRLHAHRVDEHGDLRAIERRAWRRPWQLAKHDSRRGVRDRVFGRLLQKYRAMKASRHDTKDAFRPAHSKYVVFMIRNVVRSTTYCASRPLAFSPCANSPACTRGSKLIRIPCSISCICTV